jgi:hypothetical protein
VIQQGFDFSGEQLKEHGAAAAVHHADSVHLEWSDYALLLLKDFARGRAQFSADDFRKQVNGVLPDPPSCNAIGGLFLKASKAGVIIHAGYVKSNRAAAHSRIVGLWKAAA